MKFLKALPLLILLLPALSNGQVISVLDPNGAPVNQAVLFVKNLDTHKEQVAITDASGTVKLDPSLKKVQLFISHLSFENHLDTLATLTDDIQIRLVKRKVDLGEVVVTSEYAPRNSGESVHAVTVINKQQIENQAAPNLESLLTQQLSMRVSNTAVLGSSLSMNGLTGQNIKILVDGVPMIGRLDGNIDLGQINLNNVVRIEVVNGPMAASYGTDAAGGVINLITKQAVDQKYQAGVNFMYETVGQYNVDGFAGFTQGKSALMVSGGRNFFDGWSATESGRWQEWKPKEQYFGTMNYRFTHKNLVLSYQLNVFHEKLSNKGNPRTSPYFAYALDEYYKTIRVTNQLNGSYYISKNWSASATASYSLYQRTKNTYRKDLVSLNENLVPGIEQQDTSIMNSWMGRMVFNRAKINGIVNYQAGIDIAVDNAKGNRFNGEVEQMGDYALFASAEYRVTQNLQIKPAVRVSYNTDYNSPVIPSLMVKYDFSKNIQGRVSYGKGYRAPGIKERYLYFVDINHNIVGNENLQPEHSNNFFASVNSTTTVGVTTNNIQVSGFYNNIHNLITLAQPNPYSNLYTYVNIGDYSTHGGNISNSVTWNNLTFNIGAGVTGRSTIYADSGDYKKYMYSPDFNANAQYLFRKINLTAAVYFKYNGEIPVYAINAEGTVTQYSNDDYSLLDASLRKGFFNEKVFVGAGIKNILDVTSVNAFSEGSAHSATGGEQAVGTGRNYFIRLQYAIGK